MNVLILSHLYPAPGRTGGAFVHAQARALRAAGVNVSVVSPNPLAWGLGRIHPRLRTRVETPRQVTLDGVPVAYPRVLVLPRRLLFERSGDLFYLALRRMLPHLRAAGVQIIHAHQALPDGAAAQLLARELRVPFIVTVHGIDVHRHLVEGGAVAGRAQQTLRAASMVVAVSHRVAAQLADAVPAERLVVNHNGVSTAQEPSPPEEIWPGRPMILSVSRLIASKGHADVMEALPLVCDAGLDPVWAIVGDGPQRSALEARARALGQTERVHFLGHQPHERVLRLMARADVFALPSWEEGFGLVYAEAMRQATVAVACAGEGPADFIEHGRSGFLVPPHNPQALADAVSACLADPNLRRRIGDAGRAATLGLTWERNAELQRRIYTAVLEGTPDADRTGAVGGLRPGGSV